MKARLLNSAIALATLAVLGFGPMLAHAVPCYNNHPAGTFTYWVSYRSPTSVLHIDGWDNDAFGKKWFRVVNVRTGFTVISAIDTFLQVTIPRDATYRVDYREHDSCRVPGVWKFGGSFTG